AVLATLGVTQVINRQMPTRYAATAVFFVSANAPQPSSVLEGSLFVSARLKTYTELLAGNQMLEDIEEEAHTGLTPEDLLDEIDVTTESDSALLTVTVSDGSPERAARIAQVLISLFPATVKKLEARPSKDPPAASATPVEPVARLDPEPVSPRPLHNDALAVAVGLLLGAAAGVLREI